MKSFVVAGTSSSTGKTTATLAIMNSLDGEVQPYKVGPDYIDPSHHREMTGKTSRNLDIHLMGEKGVKENFLLGNGDFGVIEGVMGLYDSFEESTAKIAETLNLPVILVLDASKGMESVAATALGFKEYGNIEIPGVILNKISSKKQLKTVKKALKKTGLQFLGAIPFHKDLEIPSRHLGLYMAEENPLKPCILKGTSKNIEIGKIKKLAKKPDIKLDSKTGKGTEKKLLNEEKLYKDTEPAKKLQYKGKPSIGVAHDSAFNFYYTRNLEILKELAEVKFFSPLRGDLPEADGYYFGGGYPELHLKELEENKKIKKAIRREVVEGKPVFAECGGFMYLAETISYKGKKHEMTGVLPVKIEMKNSLQTVGYTVLEAEKDLPIASRKDVLKGHEFHYSRAILDHDAKTGFKVKRGKGLGNRRDGVIEYNALGTYNHFHAATQPYLEKFVKNIEKT